jgi:toxin-antitoxin system PIN domain toxin
VIVPDVNLLLYAVNTDAPPHAHAKRWLDAALRGDEPVGFAWVVLIAFVRITTHARVFPSPMALDDALAIVNGWLALPVAVVIEPGPEHWRILQRLLRDAQRGGNLTTDAHLAALCIERGATLHSADADFTRFRGLRWENPLASG